MERELKEAKQEVNEAKQEVNEATKHAMRYRFQQQRLLVDNGVLNTRRALEEATGETLFLRTQQLGWNNLLHSGQQQK